MTLFKKWLKYLKKKSSFKKIIDILNWFLKLILCFKKKKKYFAKKTQNINNYIKKTDQDKKDFLRKQLAELKELKEGTSQIEQVITYLKNFIYKLFDINVSKKEVAEILVDLKNEKIELQFDNFQELEERLFEELELPEEKLNYIDREK